MVFKKMMRAFGVGGPSVDTVLANPNTRPGLTLDGQVRILGGDHDAAIEQVILGLVTRVEHEHGDGFVEFHRVPVAGAFQLRAGERRDLPFSFPVPWETPITDVYGRRLHGMTMGLRTELMVAKAVDKGDLDQVAIHPLPAQERILDAFAQLGFRFARADLEHGGIYGVRQQLPFYQEIEFYPSPQFAGAINEVEVTFIADPSGVEVVLEFDKRGGFLQPGHDAYGRFRIAHTEVETTDWTAVVAQWVSEAAGRYQGLRGAAGFGAPGAFAGHGGHAPHGYGHHGHYRRGSGMGAMAAGVAGGVLGGMALGEVAEEIFEDDGDSFDFDE
ncbi:sporulation protein [Actinoplanes sp. CA-030573]|uniref:sporulation protein n=1 Tax=Actinoplanes sp. CA-030573 TaxID=3239898 RepID=UPI003D8EA7AF